MSKKSRRARAGKFRIPKNTASSSELRRPETAEAVAEPKAGKSAAPIVPALATLQQARYHYIVPELWRIGIIAGVLFLIIIVLSFIIQ